MARCDKFLFMLFMYRTQTSPHYNVFFSVVFFIFTSFFWSIARWHPEGNWELLRYCVCKCGRWYHYESGHLDGDCTGLTGNSTDLFKYSLISAQSINCMASYFYTCNVLIYSINNGGGGGGGGRGRVAFSRFGG